MEVLLAVLVGWVLMIGLGMFVASEKGRGSGEGCLLAFLFGPFGILIEALLPSKVAPTLTPSQLRQAAAYAKVAEDEAAARDQGGEVEDPEAEREALRRLAARVEAERLAGIAEDQRREAERDRRRAERDHRRAQREDAYRARGITPGPLAWVEVISLYIVEWYNNRSDLTQMIMWAICLSIPAAILSVMLFRPK